MSTHIQQIFNPEIDYWLSKYIDWGGIIDFKIFSTSGPATVMETHLAAAQLMLHLIKKDNERYWKQMALLTDTKGDNHFSMTFRPIDANDAVEISTQKFFGSCSDPEQQKLLNQSYNTIESFSMRNDITCNDNGFVAQGYADAFLYPPHSFGKDKTNAEISAFFVDFNRFLFDDIDKITVYSWSIDCSNYFDADKEWWGSFFWTIYNPVKDWHISIAASTTD